MHSYLVGKMHAPFAHIFIYVPTLGVGERATNALVRLHGCSSPRAINTKIS